MAYRFEDSRGAECVTRHLAGFSGTLQVDGYSANANLAKARATTGSNETTQLAGCWAQIRRRFYNLHISGVSATLLQTCTMNRVDPLQRVSQTLTRIAQGLPAAEIEALMLWNFSSNATG